MPQLMTNDLWEWIRLGSTDLSEDDATLTFPYAVVIPNYPWIVETWCGHCILHVFFQIIDYALELTAPRLQFYWKGPEPRVKALVLYIQLLSPVTLKQQDCQTLDHFLYSPAFQSTLNLNGKHTLFIMLSFPQTCLSKYDSCWEKHNYCG